MFKLGRAKPKDTERGDEEAEIKKDAKYEKDAEGQKDTEGENEGFKDGKDEKAAKANEARRKRKAEAAKPDVDIQTPKPPEFNLDDLPDLPSQPKQPKTQTVVDSSPIKKDEPEPQSKRKRAFEAVDTAMARLDEAKIKYSFQFNGSA